MGPKTANRPGGTQSRNTRDKHHPNKTSENPTYRMLLARRTGGAPVATGQASSEQKKKDAKEAKEEEEDEDEEYANKEPEEERADPLLNSDRAPIVQRSHNPSP